MKNISFLLLYLSSFLPAVAKAQWTMVPPMPTARWTQTAVAGLDCTIYVIGGFDNIAYLATVEAYDPLTQTWTTRAPMPTGRANPAAARANDGRIFVFGGRNGSASLNVVEAYDPSSNTWATMAPMPTRRTGPGAAAAYNGMIYVIGGSQVGFPEVWVRTVEAYDPLSNTWATVAPLPTARSHFAAVLGMDGRIYAMGGRNSTAFFLTYRERETACADGSCASKGVNQ